jgi:hypothetical protein
MYAKQTAGFASDGSVHQNKLVHTARKQLAIVGGLG